MLSFINMYALLIVRILLIGVLIAILFSPPVTNVLELILYIMFILNSHLRTRLANIWRQPMPLATGAFFLIISIGIFYSYAPVLESFYAWISWRKIFLIPLSLAVFNTNTWKLRVIWTVISVILLHVLVSFFSFQYSDIQIYKYLPSISLRNHATQGMMFSVAMFASIILLKSFRFNKIKQALLLLISFLSFINIIFITPGRSGYLTLIVLSTIAGIFCFRKTVRYYFLYILLIWVGILSLLYISPISHNRIEEFVLQAMDKSHHVDSIDTQKVTDAGLRIIMWKNTIQMIKTRPLLGYGTGGFEQGYTSVHKNDKQFLSHDPHNQFLKILTEYGTVGMLIFIAFIVSFFFQSVQQPFYTLGIGVLLAWSFTSMCSSHFSTFTEGRFLFLWCAIMLSPLNDNNDIQHLDLHTSSVK